MINASELLEFVLKQSSNPVTRQAYEKDLADFSAHFLKGKSPQQAIELLLSRDFEHAHEVVTRYRQSMLKKRGLSSSAINRRLTVLRKLTKAANRRGWIPWVLDVRNVENSLEKNNEGLSTEETAEVLAFTASDDSPRGRRAYAILRLLCDLGLRRASIVNIDLTDLKIAGGEVGDIRVTLKRRSKKKQKKLPGETVQAIKRWLEVHPAQTLTGPLFVNLIPGRYTRLSGNAVYDTVVEYSTKAGFPTHPHGLRHTAITTSIVESGKRGKSIDTVMQFSDHSDIRMLLRYRDPDTKAQGEFAKSNASAFGNPLAKRPRLPAS